MRPSVEEKRAYRVAEDRLRESITLRDMLPGHTYPERAEDLRIMRRFHAEHGIPPARFIRWLWWWVKGGS